MPLFFTAPENIRKSEKIILIYGNEARHIIKSLRYKKNDQILISDGKGNKYISIIDNYKHQVLQCKIVRSIPDNLNSGISKIVLAQSILKSNKMDFIIQKSTELGITSIIPFISSRTIPMVSSINFDKKLKRWQKIAYESSKQSERTIIPEILPIISFKELLKNTANFNLTLIFWENERSTNLKDVITSSPKPNKILCLIGPEGGFSDEEIKLAKDAGLKSVSLGDHYLRSETAAIFVLSVITYVFNF
ncbi:MAG: RsmE family RNA methyltransferase [Atribacterota bacterium]